MCLLLVLCFVFDGMCCDVFLLCPMGRCVVNVFVCVVVLLTLFCFVLFRRVCGVD